MALAGPGPGVSAVASVLPGRAVAPSIARPTSVLAQIAAAAFDRDTLASMRKRPGMYLSPHPPVGNDTLAWRRRAIDASDYLVDVVHWRIARAFDAGSWRVRVDVETDGVDVLDAGAEAGDPNCPLVGTLVARDPWSSRFEALYLTAYSADVRLTVDDAGIHRTRVRPDASVFGDVRIDADDLAERIRGIVVGSAVTGMTVEVRDASDPAGPRQVATLLFDRTVPLPDLDPIDRPVTARRVA